MSLLSLPTSLKTITTSDRQSSSHLAARRRSTLAGLRFGREPPDRLRIAFHDWHRNTEIMPRRDQVAIEGLHLNRVTEGMREHRLVYLSCRNILRMSQILIRLRSTELVRNGSVSGYWERATSDALPLPSTHPRLSVLLKCHRCYSASHRSSRHE